MSIFLSVKEAADLSDCDYQTIKKQIQRGNISVVTIDSDKGGTKEGKQYLIDLMDLPAAVQAKYWELQRDKLIRNKTIEELVELSQDYNYSDEERKEIIKWRGILDAWNDYRFANKGRKDKNGNAIRDAVERSNEFVEMWNVSNPEFQLSHKTMVRRYAQYKEKGDVALIDKRGKVNKGKNSIPPEAWRVFCTYYLDKREFDAAYCYKWTSHWAKDNNIEIPSLKTFIRHIKTDIPAAVLCRYRDSEEGYNRNFRPYLERDYSHLKSNDIWVADNHTLDFMCNADGKIIRLYLTLYIDARSRMPVCWGVSENINADIVLDVLKSGWKRRGLPRAIMMDNGREFLTKDITETLGYRKSKPVPDAEKVPSVFEELDIEVIVCKPKRGQEKPIEREFLNVKKWFSKLFDSYIGGNTQERPDNAKDGAKYIGCMDTAEDVKVFLGKFIEGFVPFEAHRGSGMNGKRPFDVYGENLESVRKMTDEQLRHATARRTKALLIRENGITFSTGYGNFSYFIPEMVLKAGTKVYAKYDANDLSAVDIYSMDGVLMFENVPEKLVGKFGIKDEVTRAALEQNAKYNKKVNKLVKEYKDSITLKKAPSIKDMMLEEIEENLENAAEPNPIIELFVKKQEQKNTSVGNVAVGAEDIKDVKNIVSIESMYEKILKINGGKNGRID